MLNSTNLILQKINIINQHKPQQQISLAGDYAVTTPFAGSNLLTKYLTNQASINMPVVQQSPAVQQSCPIAQTEYKNNLKSLIMENKSKMLAIIPRTFNAKDTNGNEYIDGNEVHRS